MNFFGHYNGLAPLFELGHWTARTPIGQKCAWCHEQIHRCENGVELENGNCEHIECFIASIIGSVSHQDHRCTCYDGFIDCLQDEIGKRETARAAFLNWQNWGKPDLAIRL